MNYSVTRLDSKTANDMVVKYHYLHRKPSCIIAYGLYDNDILLGTCIFGKPASPFLCKGICGQEESEHVIELARLWISDEVGKNAESYFISRALKMLKHDFPKYDIVVSFADTSVGHVGTIYQACSFLYTGLSDKHVQWKIEGVSDAKHCRHIFDELGGVKKAHEILGEKMQYEERARKHRYIWFNGNRRRNFELKNKLKYGIKPYPKPNRISVKYYN